MAIEVPDLTTLSDDEVQQTIDYIAQRVGEYMPTIQRRRGVVREILIHLAGVLGAAQAKVIEEKVEKASSLKKIIEDPNGADPEMVDRIISNFRVTRRPGGRARGQVTIVLSRQIPVTIPKSLKFEAGGVTFTADSAFAARTSPGSVVSPTDRLLRPVGDGGYAFTIEVTAEKEGSSGQLKRNARLVPQGLVQNFVRAYAESDFTGGVDADTNEELLTRLQEGLADRSSSNRATIDSMIRNTKEFSRVLATSVIGYGDPEQLRYHYLFPVAFGGRIDVYVRTQDVPLALKLTKTATLIEKKAAGGVWQFSLARNEAPGFYEVRKVVVAGQDDGGQTGYEVTELIRGFDLSDDGTGLTPDIETAEEAAFTRFQTGTVRFLDTETSTDGLTVGESKKEYDVVVMVMPLVAELQTFLADRSRRPAAADVLVKAPVPCFLELNFKIYKKAGTADPDVETIKTALAAYVNNTGFDGRLSAGALAHVIHQNLPSGMTVGAIDMFGRIVRPDGKTRYVRSDETLLIPDWHEIMVTRRTVGIMLDPASISIAIDTV